MLDGTFQLSEVKNGRIDAYSVTEKALIELREKYQGRVFDVTTTKGDKEARGARMELVKLRTGLETKRKELKAPALEYSKLIDSEAKRISAQIEALEGPIDAQIAAEEERREQERQRKIAAEEARVNAIRARIDAINGIPLAVVKLSSIEIDQQRLSLKDRVLDEQTFQEFLPRVIEVRDEVLRALEGLIDAAKAREDEALRIAAERDELARLRQEAAEREQQDAQRRRDEEARQEIARTRERQIDSSIADLRGAVAMAIKHRCTATQLAEHIADLESAPITEELFGSRVAEAQTAKDHTLILLREMLESRRLAETEDAQRAEERAALQREQEKLREQQRQAALEAEQRRQQEESQRREAQEAADAAARADKQRQEAAHQQALREEAETALANFIGPRRDVLAMLVRLATVFEQLLDEEVRGVPVTQE